MNALELAKDLGMALAVLAIVAAYSVPVYAILSLPGVVICVLVRRLLRNRYWPRALVTSLAAAVLLTPVPVLSHTPLILPLPFAVWLWNYVGLEGATTVGCVFGISALIALLFVSWRYAGRAEAGQPVAGKLERWWRGV